MPVARCACGALTLTLRAAPRLTALCHCLACQRRTGAPFSANAFYPAECTEAAGPARTFIRLADSGREVRMHFCPACGSTVYWHADAAPGLVGVAVGALADPGFPPPAISVFERSRHGWVALGAAVERFDGLPAPGDA